MRPGTGEVITKGVGSVGAAICLQLGQSIAQWARSGDWPDPLTWVVIWSITGAAGFNALAGFMSGTYERWKINGRSGTIQTTENHETAKAP